MLQLKNSIFGNTLSIYLNNALYSFTKFNDILTSYNALHSILSSGEFSFPTLNVDVNEIKDNANLLVTHIFSKLTGEVNNIVGYSKTKIYEETNPDIDLYLDDLSDEYKNILLQLHTIYNISNKNLNHYRLLLYLLNNLSTIYNTNCNLTSFYFYNTVFRFIYFKKKLSTNIYSLPGFTDNQLLAIPTLMLIQTFKRLYYKISTEFVNSISYDIFSNFNHPVSQPTYLLNQFKSYLLDSRNIISEDITKYIINNIFLFGYNVSSNIFNTIKDVISDCIVSLYQTLTDDIENKFDPSDYVYRISNSTMDNGSYSNVLTKLFTNESVLLNIDSLINFNEDNRDKIHQYEDVLLSNIVKYITKNIGTMKQIVNIPIPFTSNPIYFMNSFSLIFNKYTLDYLQSTECFTYSDLQNWLDVILNPNNINITNIFNYINRHPISYLNSDFQLSFFLVMQEFINSFCDNEIFKNFILMELIPRIDNAIITLYKININWYQYVDKLIYFFKLKFTIDLLDTVQNNNISLFNQVFNFLKSTIENKLAVYKMNFTENDIKSIFSSEYEDNTKWFNIFNSFFKNAAITKYGQNYMAESYSL